MEFFEFHATVQCTAARTVYTLKKSCTVRIDPSRSWIDFGLGLIQK